MKYIALLPLFALVGCQRVSDAPEAPPTETALEIKNSDNQNRYYVIRDREFGCEYISVYGQATVPRFDQTGKQVCRNGSEKHQ